MIECVRQEAAHGPMATTLTPSSPASAGFLRLIARCIVRRAACIKKKAASLSGASFQLRRTPARRLLQRQPKRSFTSRRLAQGDAKVSHHFLATPCAKGKVV